MLTDDWFALRSFAFGSASEYNLLWHKSKLFVIDVSQAVDLEHPNALDFLVGLSSSKGCVFHSAKALARPTPAACLFPGTPGSLFFFALINCMHFFLYVCAENRLPVDNEVLLIPWRGKDAPRAATF